MVSISFPERFTGSCVCFGAMSRPTMIARARPFGRSWAGLAVPGDLRFLTRFGSRDLGTLVVAMPNEDAHLLAVVATCEVRAIGYRNGLISTSANFLLCATSSSRKTRRR